jgi:hypothetical protein
MVNSSRPSQAGIDADQINLAQQARWNVARFCVRRSQQPPRYNRCGGFIITGRPSSSEAKPVSFTSTVMIYRGKARQLCAR